MRQFFSHQLKIGTRSVHVGSLSEVSQDTQNYNCTLLSIAEHCDHVKHAA